MRASCPRDGRRERQTKKGIYCEIICEVTITLLSYSNDTTGVSTVQTVTPTQLKSKNNAGFGGFSTEDHYAECYPGYAPNNYIYYYHVFLYCYDVFL